MQPAEQLDLWAPGSQLTRVSGDVLRWHMEHGTQTVPAAQYIQDLEAEIRSLKQQVGSFGNLLEATCRCRARSHSASAKLMCFCGELTCFCGDKKQYLCQATKSACTVGMHVACRCGQLC